MRSFFASIAGESFDNDDGSDRQAIIRRCRVGELLRFEHEADNGADANAVRVLRMNGEQIGYLPRDVAGDIAPELGTRRRHHGAVAGVGRPDDGPYYGIAILVIVDEHGASTDLLREYARTVLRDSPPRDDGFEWEARDLDESVDRTRGPVTRDEMRRLFGGGPR